MKKSSIINRIKKEKGWIVRERGANIVCARAYTARNIEFTLIPAGKGFYNIMHPSYLFISTVSHFKSTQDDIRLSLNKVYLRSVIRMLKRAGIWSAIINQVFLEVNDNNRKSNKGKVRSELNSLLG